MQTSFIWLKEKGARHLVVIALVSLAAVEVISLLFTAGIRPADIFRLPADTAQKSAIEEPLLKISEIRGPRIDDQAAMIVAGKPALVTTALAPLCFTLPINIWMFLVLAYVALMVFNFSYTFQQATSETGERATRPQWFWETLYTLLFIVGWFVWDECRSHIWFPFTVVKFGLIMFALYVYLWEKKQPVWVPRLD